MRRMHFYTHFCKYPNFWAPKGRVFRRYPKFLGFSRLTGRCQGLWTSKGCTFTSICASIPVSELKKVECSVGILNFWASRAWLDVARPGPVDMKRMHFHMYFCNDPKFWAQQCRLFLRYPKILGFSHLTGRGQGLWTWKQCPFTCFFASIPISGLKNIEFSVGIPKF